jgi:hypothetical protein
LHAAQGHVVAWLTVGSQWPPSRVDTYRLALSGPNRVCVLVNDNGSVDARTDDRCLAALCVEEAMIESGLAFTRDLLPVAGLLDVRLTIGAWWDLAVRLVRAGAPHFEAAPAGELERELMLDQVAPLLADALYLHAQTFDLAEELPGITTRQHAVRQQLFRYLSEGLPALVPVLGREQLATQLCRLADAVLLFGTDRDRAALRDVLRVAERASIHDLALHHRRLMVLRAMGHFDAVVLACQSGTFPLDAQQVGELVYALQQLGAHDDAKQVARSASACTLVPLPTGIGPALAPFPSWLTQARADHDAWLEASRGYAEVGLLCASHVAARRAQATDQGDAIEKLPAPELPEDRATLPVDEVLAKAIRHAAMPLVPLSPHDTVLLEAPAALLRPQAFGAALFDSVLVPPQHDPLVAFLGAPPAAATCLIDLDPGLGRHAAAFLAVHASHRCTLLARHALHEARLSRSLSVAAGRVRLTRATESLREQAEGMRGPYLVHAPLRAEALTAVRQLLHLFETVEGALTALRIVWSATAVPNLWMHSAAQEGMALAARFGLGTTALVRDEDGFVRLPVSQAPRAHLLVSEAMHAHA